MALCVPWDNILDAVGNLDWNGQVVIDATNDLDPVGLDGKTSSEIVAELIPGARLVKAGNTLEAAVLATDPREAGGRRVIFISGDDSDAKNTVSTLFVDAGFFTIDLGGLGHGRPHPADRRTTSLAQSDSSRIAAAVSTVVRVAAAGTRGARRLWGCGHQSCNRRSLSTISMTPGTVSVRAQSRCSSHASDTQPMGLAPA